METKYKLWDDVEKTFFWNHEKGEPMFFDSEAEAEKHKDEYLDAGNYVGKPHDIIQVIPFILTQHKTR